MNPGDDYTIFNYIDPKAIDPSVRKPLPFPLETLDEEIGAAYKHLDTIQQKLVAARENPINKTPAKQKRLKALIYKCKSCKILIKEISSAAAELCF